jgi:hypothetical protein
MEANNNNETKVKKAAKAKRVRKVRKAEVVESRALVFGEPAKDRMEYAERGTRPIRGRLPDLG